MAKVKQKLVRIDTTKTTSGPSPMLVSGLPPELTKDEALTPGVLKLLLKEKDKSDARIKELEQQNKCALEDKITAEKEKLVLETKISYAVIWDILILIAGISGGGILTTWGGNKEISALFAVITVVLALTVMFGRRR